MKTKQTPRYRWLFYIRRTSDDVDAYGEASETIALVTTGFFSFEKAKVPIEIVDSGATISETQYVLLGAYSRHHHTSIKTNHFAWCPALDKLVEIIAEPVDDIGIQERLVIYVVDNVERNLNTGTLPTV
mgnify:CR=1 FL=1|jgi:hypothetical protein|tara:strand:- start:174 stop:560 length:387 start_codon:yes stop_codon:yes gene_type:complete